jgi:hypothetical protein
MIRNEAGKGGVSQSLQTVEIENYIDPCELSKKVLNEKISLAKKCPFINSVFVDRRYREAIKFKKQLSVTTTGTE